MLVRGRSRLQARVRAEGDLDFCGTLGVDRARFGLAAIRLVFELPAALTADKVATLLKLTERSCVVLQTPRTAPALMAGIRLAAFPNGQRPTTGSLDSVTVTGGSGCEGTY